MYKKIIWTEECAVGITEIDEQHKEFFRLCNHLVELAENNTNITRTEAVIAVNRLGDYILYHLGTEEELFEKYKLPNMDSHLEAHRLFRNKTKILIENVRNENYDFKEVIKGTAHFAGDWLFEHIMIQDKKYNEALHRLGVH